MEKDEIRLVNKKPKRGLKTNIFSTKTYWSTRTTHGTLSLANS